MEVFLNIFCLFKKKSFLITVLLQCLAQLWSHLVTLYVCLLEFSVCGVNIYGLSMGLGVQSSLFELILSSFCYRFFYHYSFAVTPTNTQCNVTQCNICLLGKMFPLELSFFWSGVQTPTWCFCALGSWGNFGWRVQYLHCCYTWI